MEMLDEFRRKGFDDVAEGEAVVLICGSGGYVFGEYGKTGHE